MYESADAVCPFYKRHNDKVIKCEGANCIKVDGWKDAERHIKEVCGDFFAWKKCSIAVQLNSKYEKR